MNTYVVGDLQGHFEPLLRLLDARRFDPASDRLWLVGDLVNRGPDSLRVLREIRALGSACTTVLGNHDLSTLALWRGCLNNKPVNDSLRPLLQAADADELMGWLRQQPLLHVESGWAMVHAGLPPQWTVAEAAVHAHELEVALRGDSADTFLSTMYGDEPRQWDQALSPADRLRYTTNCLTRMRYLRADGSLQMSDKGAPGSQSAGSLPWFSHPQRRSRDHQILCGHWSALGQVWWPQHRVWALDTGYVWGRSLTALHLETRRLLRVDWPGPVVPRHK